MCVIDRRTYLYPDGRRRTVETTTPCERAVGPQLCRDVVIRVARGVVVVENAASTDRTPVVHQRLIHDESGRSGGSISTRRSRTASERSPVPAPSSASSLSSPEPKTTSARLSPVIEVIPPFERSRRTHSPPPPLPTPPVPIITDDKTAQYSRPPSLDIERTLEVEYPFGSVENTSEGETTVYPIDDTGTIPGRVSRRPTAPVRHEISTPRSARILSTNETTENNFSATSLPATSLTSSSQHQTHDATEQLAIRPRGSSMTRNAGFRDEQHLISVFVQDLRAALNARFGRVPETRGVSGSIAALLVTYAILLEQYQGLGNHLERCAVDFVRYRREQVYASLK